MGPVTIPIAGSHSNLESRAHQTRIPSSFISPVANLALFTFELLGCKTSPYSSIHMSSPSLQRTIVVNGSHTLQRLAELCTVSFDVFCQGSNKDAIVSKVTQVAKGLSMVLWSLSSAANAEAVVVSTTTIREAEERESDKPVVRWTMSQQRVRSFTPHDAKRKPTDPLPPLEHTATLDFTATFQDFAEMELFVGS